MRSAGLSVSRLASMVAVSGAVMLVLTGLLGEFIGPPLDFYARDMRMEARYQKDDGLGKDAWVKDGSVYLHLERVNSEFDFGSIYLFRFDDENKLASIAQAENSGIDDQDNWILENLRETIYRLPEAQ
jgi:lipopolysaccharide export system permease protein